MKLIFCPECHDVIKMSFNTRYCECKLSWGKYLEDGLHAEIGGKTISLGFNNTDFVRAIQSRPKAGLGIRFEAFVIPEKCDTITFKKKSMNYKEYQKKSQEIIEFLKKMKINPEIIKSLENEFLDIEESYQDAFRMIDHQ